jgi:hypothetical protein
MPKSATSIGIAVKALVADAMKPHLPIYKHDLPAAARQLGPILAAQGDVFDRDGPVRVNNQSGAMPRILELAPEAVIAAVHRTHQPVGFNKARGAKGSDAASVTDELVPITLPEQVARIYLKFGDYGVPHLRGISMTPLVDALGGIRAPSGYDDAAGVWCTPVPTLNIPDHPTRRQAEAALGRRREEVATLPFADAVTRRVDGVDVVNLDLPPGEDESAFHNASALAAIRSSLPIAPGLLITAPQGNGSGAGKGRAAKFICLGAYGVPADANTGGHDPTELEKRLTADLAEAAPALQYDNMNDRILKSNQLAVALSEGSSKARVLGKTANVKLHTRAFIVVTGNALSVGEDLARRFLQVRLDPRTENPELRPFKRDLIPDDIAAHRKRFLEDWLTIVRWGCQNRDQLKTGKPFGYPDWCRMVRDPLLTLGCPDPVNGAQRSKQSDPERVAKVEFFEAWFRHYGDDPMSVVKLLGGHPSVAGLLDPHSRGRQWAATRLKKMDGSRIAGFELTASKGGDWSATTYRLQRSCEQPRGAVEDGGKPSDRAPMPPKPRIGLVARENGATHARWREPEYWATRREALLQRQDRYERIGRAR